MAAEGKGRPHPIELLAPARNAETGRQAILHGADAIYIGASSHGARKSASNTVDDIASLTEFAHRFRAKVYVTVNTLMYDGEQDEVRELVRSLYIAGVDALIVQDMGILRLDIPPIALHASTQCDTRTVAKAEFLEDVGFSQIVLARELTLKEIGEICRSVSVPVECFVHGALCVSYSGRCGASYAACGRSANRGECSQMCRLPYTLYDADGRPLLKDRHLLSLKDFNATHSLEDLMEAGVSSFKIEGRLKDVGYVKNITSWYRKELDRIISAHPEKWRRASAGAADIGFNPDPCKSFNRGFTDYFLTHRRPASVSQPLTPKSIGEHVASRSELVNGDGIAYIGRDGRYTGAYVNAIDRTGRILTSSGQKIDPGTKVRRTSSRVFDKTLAGKTAERRIGTDIILTENRAEASDERGNRVSVSYDCGHESARKPFDPRPYFEKLGNTIYRLDNFESRLPQSLFIPASVLTDLRRRLCEALDRANRATYPLELRHSENPSAIYPECALTFADNVANPEAEEFYRSHGVNKIEPALETSGNSQIPSGTRVMTTRHCLLRELGQCLRQLPSEGNATGFGIPLRLSKMPKLPLHLKSGATTFRLAFDCSRCEMHLLTD